MASSTLRHSCDRCRQHKVRCYKASGEIQTIVDDASTCERCLKADVPCVYSSKQRKRRTTSHHHHRRHHQQQNSLPFGQDGIWSSGISNNDDLDMATFDLADITNFDDNDLFGWGSNSNEVNTSPSTSMAHRPKTSETYSTETQDSSGSQHEEHEDTAINQITTISIRACRATRRLQCPTPTTPLMVNSHEVNEAFETANSLISIINTLTSPTSTQDPGLIFMALASHAHVFTLFRAICNSIQEFIGRQGEGQPDGAAFAQFVMVLQLVMHLVNRLGRSLKIGGMAKGIEQGQLPTPEEDGLGGRDGRREEESYFSGLIEGVSASFVDAAKGMLERLPAEHDRLRRIIGDLQNCMEERLNA